MDPELKYWGDKRLAAKANEAQYDPVIAIVAHPYASLGIHFAIGELTVTGGSQEDHVVVTIAEYLCSIGITAVTFDYRNRSSSWTGNDERRDYEEVVQQEIDKRCSLHTIIFAGYSYGALIASSVKPRPGLRTCYLLISMIMPPLSDMLSLGKCKPLHWLATPETNGKERVLLVCTDDDGFTSERRLRRFWNAINEHKSGSVELEVCSGGGHFWRNPESIRRLTQHVGDWIKRQLSK